MIKKGLVIGVIVLFIGASVIPAFGEKNNITAEIEVDKNKIENNREMLFYDYFDDNTKDHNNWTESHTDGIWYEQNQQTEFYLPSGNEKYEAIQSFEIPIKTTNIDSVNISFDMISKIGSNTDYGKICCIVRDGPTFILLCYSRLENNLMFYDSNDADWTIIGSRSDGIWNNKIEIFNDRYKVKMHNYETGWKYDPLFLDSTHLTVEILIKFQISAGSWWQAGFDNVIVEGIPLNEPPDSPYNPNPTDEETDVEINSDVSWMCDDPDGGNLTFDVYFGNNYPPSKVVENYSNFSYDPGVLDYCTMYYWQIVAFDEEGRTTIGDIWEFKTVCNGPPDAPRINGPTSGKPDITYSFTFVSEDPNDDDVFYEIDWGDGQVDTWDGPHKSNEVIIKNHSWDYQGTFIISARAKDVYENIGDWGELEVTIPRSRLLTNPFILQLLERFPILQRFLSILEVLKV